MNPNAQQLNVFFYSKFSIMCTDLLKMMDSYGILRQFLLRCIDDMPNPPPGLDRVPTLIVAGIGKPLVAREAVMWFNNARPMFMQQSTDLQNKRIMQNIMKNNMQSMAGPKGYAHEEFDGFSDGFAYLDVDMAQPKKFVEYGNDNSIIYTPPKEEKGDTIKLAEQERSCNNLDQMRKQQDIEYKAMMAQEQVNTVMANECDLLMKKRLGL